MFTPTSTHETSFRSNKAYLLIQLHIASHVWLTIQFHSELIINNRDYLLLNNIYNEVVFEFIVFVEILTIHLTIHLTTNIKMRLLILFREIETKFTSEC